MRVLACAFAVMIGAGVGIASLTIQNVTQTGPIGYTDTPMLPGGKWHVHDSARPQAPAVDPGTRVGPVPARPPSDAITLFDGSNLSKWRTKEGKPPAWIVADGTLQVPPQGTPDGGDILTRDVFGDCQLHVEWATPNPPVGEIMNRGNSGVFLAGLYEVQVFESYRSGIYADGQAGAIYGQYLPLVNACLEPGEWQAFDILFTPPQFDGDKVVSPAYITVLHNGIVVQNHAAILGSTGHRILPKYSAHAPQSPLMLQAHGNPVRYRNIWIRTGVGPR